MKAVVQRVLTASVNVGDELVSSIGKGICVLVGISRGDTAKDIEYMVRKIVNLRIFEDDKGKKWNKSVKDKQYEILCVSQFTLYCTLKGNKPDYHLSMAADLSQQFYGNFITELGKAYSADKIKDGRFGAMMNVNIVNDGPVTIQLESPDHLKGSGNSSSKNSSQESTSSLAETFSKAADIKSDGHGDSKNEDKKDKLEQNND